MGRSLLILLIGVMAAFSPLSAKHLTPAQALKKAGLVKETKVHKTVKSLDNDNEDDGDDEGIMGSAYDLSYAGTSGQDTMVYVFNNTDTDGFVIVVADDSADDTILGYSDEGSFDPDNIPSSMAWWISQYCNSLAEALANSDVNAPQTATANPNRPEIAPMLTTRWNQTAPFNDSIPLYQGEKCPVGCVATSLGQVMYNLKWPPNGTSSRAYTPSGTGTRMYVNFAETYFDWDSMDEYYDLGGTSEYSNAQVATLMKAIGVSVSMSYRPTASSSNYLTASRAMFKYFKFNNSVRCLNADCFDHDDWIDILYNELAEGRPVMYSGTGPSGGHAFVCDGYMNGDYFHLNWGWGGACDGYFKIFSLTPTANDSFNNGQSMIVGIMPLVNDGKYYPVLQCSSDMLIEQEEYPYTTSTLVRVLDNNGIFNMGVEKLTLRPGLRLRDVQGVETFIPANSNVTLTAGEATRGFYISARSFPAEGIYEVTPAVRDANNEIHDIYVNRANIHTWYLLSDGETLRFANSQPETYNIDNEESEMTVTNLTLRTALYNGTEAIVTATIAAPKKKNFSADVRPVLMNKDGIVARGPIVEVDLAKGQTADYVWTGEFEGEFAAGIYTLCLVNTDDTPVSQGIQVEATAPTIEASIDAIESDNTQYIASDFDGTILHLSAPEGIINVEVFNVAGNKIIDFHAGGDSDVDLDMSQLVRDIYLVRTTDGGFNTHVFKVLKR